MIIGKSMLEFQNGENITLKETAQSCDQVWTNRQVNIFSPSFLETFSCRMPKRDFKQYPKTSALFTKFMKSYAQKPWRCQCLQIFSISVFSGACLFACMYVLSNLILLIRFDLVTCKCMHTGRHNWRHRRPRSVNTDSTGVLGHNFIWTWCFLFLMSMCVFICVCLRVHVQMCLWKHLYVHACVCL